jgi:hypothetical protein
VFLSEVGCKRAAAANVVFVFSGAGKFTEEAKFVGPKLLQCMVKLHYNWKYAFLRPTIEEVCTRYTAQFHDVAPEMEMAAVEAAAAAVEDVLTPKLRCNGLVVDAASRGAGEPSLSDSRWVVSRMLQPYAEHLHTRAHTHKHTWAGVARFTNSEPERERVRVLDLLDIMLDIHGYSCIDCVDIYGYPWMLCFVTMYNIESMWFSVSNTFIQSSNPLATEPIG